MNRFDYIRPATVAEAVAAAAVPGSAYLAGGTNLIDLMKGGVVSPKRLVDVSRLPGLDRIEPLPDGGMRIGVRVRNADLAYDPTFSKGFPAVAEALLSGASGQLRNAATLMRRSTNVEDGSACKDMEGASVYKGQNSRADAMMHKPGMEKRKPRADAIRNRERVLEAAKTVFNQGGPEASLEAVARRAGVGIGTLCRHFPTRETLYEAVYRHEVEQLVELARHLGAETPPVEALRRWLQAGVEFMATKKGMAAALAMAAQAPRTSWPTRLTG